MNDLIGYQSFEIVRQETAIRITNKMLLKIENDLPVLIPYRKGNKWGYCDKNMIIKIECKYDEVTLFSEGLAAVKLYTYKGFTIYIDKNGKCAFVTYSEPVKGFKNGIAIVSSNKKYGIINNLGNLICECKYRYIPDFRENRAIVCFNYSYGVIDASGKILIESIYDDIYFNGNIFILYLDGKCGVSDLDGNMVQPFVFEAVSGFSEGYARIYKDYKYGFIDINGKLVIDCIYYKLEIMGNNLDEDFDKGFALVWTNTTPSKRGYIDYTGKWFDENPNGLSEGLLKLFKSQTDSFSDSKMEIAVGYDNVRDLRNNELREGFYRVSLNGKFGFVNEEGVLVIECIYEGAASFYDGVAWVRLHGKWGVIDKNGNVIIDFIYQIHKALEWQGFRDGVCIIVFHKKFGVINKTGNIIIDFIYDEIVRQRTSGFFEARIKTDNWKPDSKGDFYKNYQNDILNLRRSLFDISGKGIIHDYFGDIPDFEDGLLKITEGYVDKNGNKYWED